MEPLFLWRRRPAKLTEELRRRTVWRRAQGRLEERGESSSLWMRERKVRCLVWERDRC